MLTKEALAERLNGREYMEEITSDEEREAKESGLVVIFGASDDNVELRGAIDEELSAFEGCEFCIVDGKLVPEIDDDDEEVLEKYGVLELVKEKQGKGIQVEALWCDTDDYSWTFKTDTPNATFDIMEDDDKFCRGIVIEVKQP